MEELVREFNDFERSARETKMRTGFVSHFTHGPLGVADGSPLGGFIEPPEQIEIIGFSAD
ncbi:MAG: hypothetical protein FWB80_03880 [Defluviitaleaceae bacterium]|nr:hypothetical protein [Defluviitaleaceae bacterium]